MASYKGSMSSPLFIGAVSILVPLGFGSLEDSVGPLGFGFGSLEVLARKKIRMTSLNGNAEKTENGNRISDMRQDSGLTEKSIPVKKMTNLSAPTILANVWKPQTSQDRIGITAEKEVRTKRFKLESSHVEIEAGNTNEEGLTVKSNSTIPEQLSHVLNVKSSNTIPEQQNHNTVSDGGTGPASSLSGFKSLPKFPNTTAVPSAKKVPPKPSDAQLETERNQKIQKATPGPKDSKRHPPLSKPITKPSNSLSASSPASPPTLAELEKSKRATTQVVPLTQLSSLREVPLTQLSSLREVPASSVPAGGNSAGFPLQKRSSTLRSVASAVRLSHTYRKKSLDPITGWREWEQAQVFRQDIDQTPFQSCFDTEDCILDETKEIFDDTDSDSDEESDEGKKKKEKVRKFQEEGKTARGGVGQEEEEGKTIIKPREKKKILAKKKAKIVYKNDVDAAILSRGVRIGATGAAKCGFCSTDAQQGLYTFSDFWYKMQMSERGFPENPDDVLRENLPGFKDTASEPLAWALTKKTEQVENHTGKETTKATYFLVFTGTQFAKELLRSLDYDVVNIEQVVEVFRGKLLSKNNNSLYFQKGVSENGVSENNNSLYFQKGAVSENGVSENNNSLYLQKGYDSLYFHEGYADRLYNDAKLTETIMGVLEEIHADKSGNTGLVITGHSMGAALAAMVMEWVQAGVYDPEVLFGTTDLPDMKSRENIHHWRDGEKTFIRKPLAKMEDAMRFVKESFVKESRKKEDNSEKNNNDLGNNFSRTPLLAARDLLSKKVECPRISAVLFCGPMIHVIPPMKFASKRASKNCSSWQSEPSHEECENFLKLREKNSWIVPKNARQYIHGMDIVHLLPNVNEVLGLETFEKKKCSPTCFVKYLLKCFDPKNHQPSLVSSLEQQNASLGHQSASLGQQNASLGQQNASLGQQNASLGQQNPSSLGQQSASLGQQNSDDPGNRIDDNAGACVQAIQCSCLRFAPMDAEVFYLKSRPNKSIFPKMFRVDTLPSPLSRMPPQERQESSYESDEFQDVEESSLESDTENL